MSETADVPPAVVTTTPDPISSDQAATMLGQPPMVTGKWATYEFGLRLLSPMLLDRMTNEQIKGLVTGQKVDYPKDESLDRKAERKLYSDKYTDDMPAGQFGVPREHVYAMLRDGGEHVQYGSGKHDRVTLSTKGTQLYGMVRLHESFFPVIGLDGKPAEWVPDLRKGNATQGSGAVGIIRPRFDEGGFVGHVDVNVELLSPDKARELFCTGGIRQGLGSARPSKKMPFGQLTLVHFKWVDGFNPDEAS